MKTLRKNRSKNLRNSQKGVALLIALIALLLISGVAVAMIVASGSESTLNGNYRSSSSAYLAAFSGIEEARGRLLPSNANTLLGVANIPQLGTTMPVGQVAYIANPAATESFATTAALLTKYPDTQYDQEFGSGALATAVKPPAPIPSKSGVNASNIPGPLYKWVRINPVTERSLGIDVNKDGNIDAVTPLFYDTAQTPPSLIVPSPAGALPLVSATQFQVLELTSLAVLPNGTERMAQYLVTPQTLGLNFTSPLTLAGTVGNFSPASSANYAVNGTDGSGAPPAVPGCTPNPANSLPGIGVTDTAGFPNGTNQQTVTNSITKRQGNYTGAGLAVPSVTDVSLTSALQSPVTIDQLVYNLKQSADVVMQPNPPPVNPNFNNSGTTYNFGQNAANYTWPTDMSASNPKVVYVDGSFDLGPNTGYGILVVTGNFHYHGNSGWKGIVLVVGDGTTTFDGQGGGNGEFDGAIFVATTRDGSGNQLNSFGSVDFQIAGGGGNGVYYNSCWINRVQQPPTYRVLSFREIAYTAPGT
jgi:hypothetical protein